MNILKKKITILIRLNNSYFKLRSNAKESLASFLGINHSQFLHILHQLKEHCQDKILPNIDFFFVLISLLSSVKNLIDYFAKYILLEPDFMGSAFIWAVVRKAACAFSPSHSD